MIRFTRLFYDFDRPCSLGCCRRAADEPRDHLPAPGHIQPAPGRHQPRLRALPPSQHQRPDVGHVHRLRHPLRHRPPQPDQQQARQQGGGEEGGEEGGCEGVKGEERGAGDKGEVKEEEGVGVSEAGNPK